jgi:hypothetical protein
MKFAHLLVSAYLAERPETALVQRNDRWGRLRAPVRHDRVSTSARGDTYREQGTASTTKGP